MVVVKKLATGWQKFKLITQKSSIMKRIYPFAFMLLFTYQLSGQTVARITVLKDAWGESITYVGEVKNKVPNGLGLAIYNNNNVIRYAGYFENGVYSGKGAMVFKDGSFLSGDWKNGKLNGKGANLNSTGDFYTGDFVNGQREGSGTFFYRNNNFIIGNFKNDKFDGRCIYLSNGGKILSDNLYKDDQKNGGGYQFELSTKKLYEGIWSNGQWVRSGSANFNSFFKNPNFISEMTEKQYIIGVEDPNRKLINDTAFFYDVIKKKKYFGLYKMGYLKKGLIIRDDSTRLIGSYNDDGTYGQASFYKVGRYYDEGNYEKDFLSGNNNMSIEVDKKTIYYGQTNAGNFTGDAWFANNSNELMKGRFLKGYLNGEGWKLDAQGNLVKGTFENGYLVKPAKISTSEGVDISLTPKTLAEAITTSTILSASYYVPISGKPSYTNPDNNDFYFKYTDSSLLKFPGCTRGDLIAWDSDEYPVYIAHYTENTDSIKAIAKYKDLAKQITAAAIILKKGQKPVKLMGNVVMPVSADYATVSYFNYPPTVKGYENLSTAVVLIKNEEGKYRVVIAQGDRTSIERWIDNINYPEDDDF